jgi:hypothetical protein
MKRIAAPPILLATLVAVASIIGLQRAAAHAGPPAQAAGELSLITATPEEGFALAITLSRKAVTETQPDTDILHSLRPGYAHDAAALIAVSHVVAVNFQTVAAANEYWRE